MGAAATTIPVFVSTEVKEKRDRDSISSFTISINDVGGFLSDNKMPYSPSSSGSSDAMRNSRLSLHSSDDEATQNDVSERPASIAFSIDPTPRSNDSPV